MRSQPRGCRPARDASTLERATRFKNGHVLFRKNGKSDTIDANRISRMSQAIGWPMDRALAGANGYRQDVSYDLGYNADELREIFRLIDWMMQLRADLSAKFEEELVTLEEVLSMPYVTSVERIAEARGEVKGGAGVLLTQLNTLCGPVPAELEEHVRHLPFDRLEALAKAVLDFRGLEDVQAWLDAHGGLGE